MGLQMGQWQVAGTVATTVCTFQIPPGPYNIVLYNANMAPATATTFFLGIGTSPTIAPPGLSTLSGLVMHSIPTSFNGYQGASAGYLWAISNQTVASSFNFILVTQQR